MPDDCAQYLQKCSLRIWSRDSFPRAGVTQSVTFSNGLTLTCTSTGRDKPRDCQLSRGAEESRKAEQCAHLKNRLSAATKAQVDLQTSLGLERYDLDRALADTPAGVDQRIEIMQARIRFNDKQPPSSAAAREGYIARQELNFLLDLRTNLQTNETLGSGMGATQAKMQEREKRVIAEQQASDDILQQANDREIRSAQDQISSLGCDQVPTVNQ